MNANTPYDAMFSGVIGQEYDLLKLICPFATEMSRLVGAKLGELAATHQQSLQVVELGGGTGITTLAILSAQPDLKVLSIDNEPTMQRQAQQSLKTWVDEGRLSFSGEDALTALIAMPSDSVDAIGSAYTLHNFECTYRQKVIQEIFRVLKPGACFVNGDRYALDDIDAHTRATQQEVAGYFKVLTDIQRLDVLEHWIIHLFSDESANHVMREAVARQQLAAAGFQQIEFSHRLAVNALLTAIKPLS